MDSESASSPLGPVTSTTLLQGLLEPDNRTIWRQYVERYRPLVVRCAVQLGVPPDDAEDVAQATLLAFSTAYREGKYDRAKGRLSAWLFGIARNQIRAWARRRRDELAPTGASTQDLDVAAEADGLQELWEREWRDAILKECLRIVRREVEPRTIRAFELFALEERSAAEVAAELDLTENAVFGAKRRVLARVRELMPLVEDAW